jgi:uncharacterized membrane protein
MKIGKMEGSPEEIKDFFQNIDLNIADYLERTEQPMKSIWFVLPVVMVIFSLSWLTLFAPSLVALQTFIFSIGCGGGIWLAVNVQIRFKNTWAAVFVAIGAVLLMMVAIGLVTPTEMLQSLKEFKK